MPWIICEVKMKKLILSLAVLLLAAGIAGAIPNPAAVYCIESGYEYEDGDCSDTNSLILWYEFDETDGNTAGDSSSYEHHGYVDVDVDELPNGPNWDPNDGRYGGCLIFDDDTAVIVPNDVLSDINDGITIQVWLRNAYREDGDNWVFDMGAGDFRVQAAVVTEPEREVLWRAGNDTNDVLTWDLDGIDPTWLTEWHPWTFVKDERAGTMSIYLKNPMFPGPWCLTASKTGVSKTLVNVRNTPFKIGALTNHQNDFVGQMDDFRIYDRVLSYCEICWCPPCAWGPRPYDGQPDAAPDVVLTWSPGWMGAEHAAEHDVYFGTNSDEVWDANSVNHPNVNYNNVTQTTYDPGLLEFGKTYYWRVDEVNGPNIWKCGLWRFTVADFIIIDDFEDDANNQDLYDDWYKIASAGISLRSTPPEIIGEHSMRYAYDNWLDFGPGYYSETQTKNLEPNDWDYYDIRVISLWFYGQAGNEATLYTQMNLGLEDNSNYGVVKYGDAGDEDMTDIQIEDWQNWEILTSRFANIDFNDVKKFCIGFGIRGNSIPQPTGYGTVFFDDIHLYPPYCIPEHGPEADLNNNCVVDFADIEIMARDWLMTDGWLLPRPPEPAVGWWKLDEGEGNVATDHAGYDNNGVIETIDQDVWWGAGRYGNALEFDGGRVLVPDALELRPAAQVTVSAWVYYSEQQDHSARVVVKGADNKETYSIEINDYDEVVFQVRNVNGTMYAIVSNDIYRDQWMHLVGTYDGSLMKLWVNAQVVDSRDDVVSIQLSQDTNDLAIGNRSDATNREFFGTIDDVQVYDYALSQAEILYIGGWPPIYIPLESPANIYDEEPPGVKAVNFRDYAVLANSWFEKELWPEL